MHLLIHWLLPICRVKQQPASGGGLRDGASPPRYSPMRTLEVWCGPARHYLL